MGLAFIAGLALVALWVFEPTTFIFVGYGLAALGAIWGMVVTYFRVMPPVYRVEAEPAGNISAQGEFRQSADLIEDQPLYSKARVPQRSACRSSKRRFQ